MSSFYCIILIKRVKERSNVKNVFSKKLMTFFKYTKEFEKLPFRLAKHLIVKIVNVVNIDHIYDLSSPFPNANFSSSYGIKINFVRKFKPNLLLMKAIVLKIIFPPGTRNKTS
jgi:hypothetical protein